MALLKLNHKSKKITVKIPGITWKVIENLYKFPSKRVEFELNRIRERAIRRCAMNEVEFPEDRLMIVQITGNKVGTITFK